MADVVVDDVKALLEGDFGDDQILKNIYRACKNGEVVSNYEKKYVRDLVELHLGRGGVDNDPDADRTPSATGEVDVAPDAILPGQPAVTRAEVETQAGGAYDTSKEQQPPDAGEDGRVRLVSSTVRQRSGPSKGKIVVISAGCALALLAVALGAAMSGPTTDPDDNMPGVGPVAEPELDAFHVRTDLAQYSVGDFVSISGSSDAEGDVTLSIENPAGEVAWTESVQTKSDGAYSTMTIAGAGTGWSEPGTFVVVAENALDAVVTEFELVD